jgi:hypothetical protein
MAQVQRADFAPVQEFRSENRDDVINEERMKENEERFHVKFATMDVETARKIQSEVDRNPSSEMARAGLKEQAQYAADKNLESLKAKEEEEEEVEEEVEEVPENVSQGQEGEGANLRHSKRTPNGSSSKQEVDKPAGEEAGEPTDQSDKPHGFLNSISKFFGSLFHAKQQPIDKTKTKG